MSPSIPVDDFAAWYRLCGEFFKACRAGAKLDEIENGHKALTLAYFGIQKPLTKIEEVKANAIFTLAGRELLTAELTEDTTP
jgi:hypothetical protein